MIFRHADGEEQTIVESGTRLAAVGARPVGGDYPNIATDLDRSVASISSRLAALRRAERIARKMAGADQTASAATASASTPMKFI
jgi:hypothetical protein